MVCRCCMASSTDKPYVSRAGLKLEHALREFGVDVTDLVCADFGCNVGGFTDCLLKHGAATVYALDTGYGVLDYTLRKDPRVVVMERTNALYVEVPELEIRPSPKPSPGGRGLTERPSPKPSSGGPGGKGLEEEDQASDSPLPPGEGSGVRAKRNSPLDPEFLAFARELRQQQTDAEQLIWRLLRDHRFLDLKFRRQHPLKPYVLDFYCCEARLAIELDGGQHNEPAQRRKDQTRSRFIQSQGIRVVRFWDHDVLLNTEAVLEAIVRAVEEIRPSPKPSSGGPGGRGLEERGVDLITIDLGWTKQLHAIPAALKWLEPTAGGRIISLIKPHYELTDHEREAILVDGALSAADAHAVFERVLDAMGEFGVEVRASTKSPITGAKSSRKKRGGGNVEYLALLSPVSDR